MKAIIWLYLGKFAVSQWIALTDSGQQEVIYNIAWLYASQYSCQKVEIKALELGDNIEFFANCKELKL